jgi:hypothetical protein
MKCVSTEEGQFIVEEIHQGVCGIYQGGRSLAQRIIRQGYFWPTLKKDAVLFARKCKACQIHKNIQRNPATQLTGVESPIPFAMWGLDIVGPFPVSTGQAKFIFVAVDYFTKWVEALAVPKITQGAATKFVFKCIMCRFGVPMHIVTDNGTQFTGGEFTRLCENMGTRIHFSSVYRPQGNGQVEVTNRAIVQGLKKKVEQAKGSWADLLPEILWAYRTTEKTPTGETPFSLAYGMEALIPTELSIPTVRVLSYDMEENMRSCATTLDLVDELRDNAQAKNAAYKQSIARYHDRNVKGKAIRKGILVWRRASVGRKDCSKGKLGANWEGPYVVEEELRPGTYKLKQEDGTGIPNTWHADNLQLYF